MAAPVTRGTGVRVKALHFQGHCKHMAHTVALHSHANDLFPPVLVDRSGGPIVGALSLVRQGPPPLLLAVEHDDTAARLSHRFNTHSLTAVMRLRDDGKVSVVVRATERDVCGERDGAGVAFVRRAVD